jgi:hypothetical protein
VAFATVLFHVKGYTAPETIAAFERADAMIEQAEALGERPEGEDALLRFSVLYGQWTGNHSAGNLRKHSRWQSISSWWRKGNGYLHHC